jgi:predicted nuclease of predicted toxin-antitoxin system
LRLLLDEMIPPQVVRGLREAGYDVQAIKRDRNDLLGSSDLELVRCMATERRTIVTNDVDDFQKLHDQFLATGDEYQGMVFTFDATMPRTKDAIPQWVQTLTKLLAQHTDNDSLQNQILHLP